jgi:hypothetical protein
MFTLYLLKFYSVSVHAKGTSLIPSSAKRQAEGKHMCCTNVQTATKIIIKQKRIKATFKIVDVWRQKAAVKLQELKICFPGLVSIVWIGFLETYWNTGRKLIKTPNSTPFLSKIRLGALYRSCKIASNMCCGIVNIGYLILVWPVLAAIKYVLWDSQYWLPHTGVANTNHQICAVGQPIFATSYWCGQYWPSNMCYGIANIGYIIVWASSY